MGGPLGSRGNLAVGIPSSKGGEITGSRGGRVISPGERVLKGVRRGGGEPARCSRTDLSFPRGKRRGIREGSSTLGVEES